MQLRISIFHIQTGFVGKRNKMCQKKMFRSIKSLSIVFLHISSSTPNRHIHILEQFKLEQAQTSKDKGRAEKDKQDKLHMEESYQAMNSLDQVG